MSLEAWGDDGEAERPYTEERVAEIVAEETAELLSALEAMLAVYAELHARYDLGDCDATDLAKRAVANAKARSA